MNSPKFCFSFVLLLAALCMNSLMAQYTPLSWPSGTVGGYLKGYSPQGQQQSNWCWAASGSMTMTYVNASTAPNQCREASDRFGTDCCANGSSSACNNGGWPNFEAYGYQKTETNDGTPLTFEQIKTTLQSNSPICYVWWWSSGGGHMMTAFGWAEATDGRKWVRIADPLPPGSNSGTVKWITYDAYVSGSYYSHGPDFYDIKR